MIPTIEFIQRNFREFNHLMFDGKLPEIPIELGNAKGYEGKICYTAKRSMFGKKTYSNFRLRMNTRYDLPEEQIEDTIIHEMIHLYILVNGIKDTSSHGQIFRRLMNDINSHFNRHITISGRRTEEQDAQDTRIRDHYICVTTLASGEQGITLTTSQNIAKITKSLPQRYRFREYQWYVSTDPFFNRYPHSHTARIFKISPADLDLHLQGAIPLRSSQV